MFIMTLRNKAIVEIYVTFQKKVLFLIKHLITFRGIRFTYYTSYTEGNC